MCVPCYCLGTIKESKNIVCFSTKTTKLIIQKKWNDGRVQKNLGKKEVESFFFLVVKKKKKNVELHFNFTIPSSPLPLYKKIILNYSLINKNIIYTTYYTYCHQQHYYIIIIINYITSKLDCRLLLYRQRIH